MEHFRKILVYFSIFCISLFIACLVFQVYQADMDIPFYYLTSDTKFPHLNFDVNLYLATSKNVSEGGWVGEYARLGAPGVVNMADYPMAYFQQHCYFVIKIFIWLGASYEMAINLFFLITFPFIALAAFYFLRKQEISPMIAACISILYAFLPYHIHTGQMHLSLSSYFIVPLSMVIAFWIVEGKFFKQGEKKRLDFSKVFLSILFLLFIATSDVYYSYYAIFIFVICGFIASFEKQDKTPFWIGGLASCLIVFFILILLIPAWWYKFQNGSVASFYRHWTHSEVWGLKIVQLFIPIRDHILEPFSVIAEEYTGAPNVNVNEAVSLGLIGSFGFLSLIFIFLVSLPAKDSLEKRLQLITKLNIISVLFAISGGFSTLFALFVYPSFRSNYRMGVYLGLFSLFAIAVILEKLQKKEFWQNHRKLFYVVLVLLTLTGILDQNGKLAVPQYDKIQSTFYSNKTFFSSLEKALPEGSMVFQLPYSPFPEGGKVGRIHMYEQFIPFLHTKSIRWSYGVVQGRPEDTWQKEVVSCPPPAMIQKLQEAHFKAILIDKNGYCKPGELQFLLRDIKEYVLHPPMISSDKRYMAFMIKE